MLCTQCFSFFAKVFRAQLLCIIPAAYNVKKCLFFSNCSVFMSIYIINMSSQRTSSKYTFARFCYRNNAKSCENEKKRRNSQYTRHTIHENTYIPQAKPTYDFVAVSLSICRSKLALFVENLHSNYENSVFQFSSFPARMILYIFKYILSNFSHRKCVWNLHSRAA